MGPPELITRVLPTGDWQGGSPSTSSHLDKRTSDLALSNDEEFDTGHQVPPPFTPYYAHSTANIIQTLHLK
ncbi:hypothetical protein L798_09228 [Zootermopsis nevadensis]|uniref:Uncharacterized protein n=1 Tax=Zootermopsis nevadensis TaxID=136037 RepID=A0A067RDL8_ZOONE|nr:hypothetical protein L798_09228 [Zootermopsis nevadensis]